MYFAGTYSYVGKRESEGKKPVLWIQNDLVRIWIRILLLKLFWIRILPFEPGQLNNCQILIFLMGLLQDF
jgi:hypothetical protein